MARVAVVIPTYKDTLTEFEQISLTQVRRVLGNYPIIFVAPEGTMFPYFFAGSRAVHFPRQFFQSVYTYNALMLSPLFYNAFREYEYILVYQLDAFVFSDKLEYFCGLGYDYIGAPWISVHGRGLHVGNGGFCLKNVKAHYKLLTDHRADADRWSAESKPEDVFFAHCGVRKDINFNVAPVNVASRFAVEHLPARYVKKNGGELPFGCHDWNDLGADFYVETLLSLGYDIRALRNQMHDFDVSGLRDWLVNIAFSRLSRRLRNGQPILRYLAQNRFASIRVVRHPFAMMLLTRLTMGDSNLSDRIYFYNANEHAILIRDLKKERHSKFLLSFGDNAADVAMTPFSAGGGGLYYKL